ncbi:hypothetical protein [Maricaulis sp.]|uniref:hypothetical protein n=1 Tax=Maricaulis sp. TaxID=1486257 RepID=UPI0026160732|nr:hypothetical protein [Maricaulis sp.]
MIPIIVIVFGVVALLVLWGVAACAKRWAESLKRRYYHTEEFFKHANAVYDERVQPVPDIVKLMIDAMAEGTMDKDFANFLLYILTNGPAPARQQSEIAQSAEAAMSAISKKQAEHFIVALLHAGLASAECSFLFGREKAKTFVALLENPVRAQAMTQKVVRFDWTDTHRHGGNHATV